MGAGALLAFGAWLLRPGLRTGPALVLGLFAAFWGAQVALVRLWTMAQPGGREFLLLSTAFLLPLPMLLAHFAASFPAPLAAARSRLWLPALALPALAWLAVLLADPAGALQRTDTSGIVWGWATYVLLTPALVAAMAFALARFARAHLDPRGGMKAGAGLCALGLLLYLAHWLPRLALQAPIGWPAAVAQYGFPAALVVHASIAAGLVAVLATGAALAARTRGRARLRWGLALAVSLLLAAATAPLDPVGGFLGLFRLAMVALMAYAVARHHLLGVELRLRSWARPGLAAALGLAVWGALASAAWYAAGGAWPGGGAVPLLAGLAGAGSAAAAWPRLGAWVDARFPYIRATEEYLLRRRLEVYRAAAMAGTGPPALDALAAELRLRPEDRAVAARSLARSAGRAPPASPGPRYEVEGILAEGVYGRVLLARDLRLRRRVVLKEFQGLGGAGAARSFAREAKVLVDLDHPHVVRVTDVFRAGEDLFMATEHAEGGDLDVRLRERGALPPEEAVGVASQVLEALAAAHRRGIVHRDVKPANVLFDDGRVKLADFGVALDPVLDGAARAAAAQAGTLGWMAPEQARGEGASQASDVHAVGAMLVRMLTGHHYLPLLGLEEHEVRRAICDRAPSLEHPAIPAVLRPVLARALAKDPRARYPDAAAMLRDLRRAHETAAAAVPPAAL